MKKELIDIATRLIAATLENVKENCGDVECAALQEAVKLLKLAQKESEA